MGGSVQARWVVVGPVYQMNGRSAYAMTARNARRTTDHPAAVDEMLPANQGDGRDAHQANHPRMPECRKRQTIVLPSRPGSTVR